MYTIELPKTGLVFQNDKLTKYGEMDKVLARFDREVITDIRLTKAHDYAVALMIGLPSFGFALVSKIFIPYQGLSWAATILCLCGVLFAMFCLQITKVEIETTNGLVSYQNMDQIDEAEGFVLSVRHELTSLRDTRDSTGIQSDLDL